MALSDIVTISITTETAKLERAGFGMPVILAADAPGGFTERVRFYTDLTGVAVDFASTTATYKMAAQVFAQNPRPPKIAVGRLANKPTQRWALTPVVTHSHKYQVKVDDTLVEYQADSATTANEIIVGLKAAIDALGKAITTSDETTFLRVVANAAGVFFSVESLDTTKLKVAQDHADPGLAADLDAIKLENSTWYDVKHAFNSSACLLAIAAWVESNKKFFVAQSQDSDIENLADGADTGGSITAAKQLKVDARFRTALVYHRKTSAFADAGWAGACLPLDPGSETWAYKTLSGVSALTLTATQRTNILAKNANLYETVAGVNVTSDGKVAGNEYIDVIRFRDWLEAGMSEDIAAAIFKAKKIPFTDAGISVIEGIVKARLKAGVDAGGLASDPAPKVTVPKASAVSGADKAARKLTGLKFDAILAGAIQAVSLSGVITV